MKNNRKLFKTYYSECSKFKHPFRAVWRVGDGLPLDMVLAIAPTTNGFVWVGTEAGLAH